MDLAAEGQAVAADCRVGVELPVGVVLGGGEPAELVAVLPAELHRRLFSARGTGVSGLSVVWSLRPEAMTDAARSTHDSQM